MSLSAVGNSVHEVIVIESQDPDESPDDQLVEQDGTISICGAGGAIGVDVAQHQGAGGSSGVGAAATRGERRKPERAGGDARQVPEDEEEQSIRNLERARRYLDSEEEETESDGDGDDELDCGEGSGSRKRKGVTHCQSLSCESVEPRRMQLPHVL